MSQAIASANAAADRLGRVPERDARDRTAQQ
jgi:hypothetical protein